MTKEQKRTIENQLKNYQQTQARIAEMIAGVSEAGLCAKYKNDGGGAASVRSAIDFSLGLAAITERKDYRWGMAIVKAFCYYGENSYISEVIKCRYFRYAWERLYVYRVCAEMHISKTALFKCIDDFLNTVHKYAINAGLMSVE